jgi:hypothetical protein
MTSGKKSKVSVTSKYIGCPTSGVAQRAMTEVMWTAPEEIVVDRERHTVQSPKFMLMVVWNPIGFHVPCSESPPEGAQIQCTMFLYYTNNILVAIPDWGKQTEGTQPNKLWVHSDNARPHTAKMSRDYIGLNRMKQAPYCPRRQLRGLCVVAPIQI